MTVTPASSSTGTGTDDEVIIEDADQAELDLTHLIEDTQMGEKLGEVIKDVVKTTTTETGDTVTETRIWVGGLESSYTYTGSAIKPAIHVYDGIRELGSSDYSVSYKNNTNAGSTAQITVKFKGNYATKTPAQTLHFTPFRT